MFPNPVQDFVNIESDKNFISYEIIDENGKSILSKDFKGSKIDISNLKTGVYFIKLKSLSNETNVVKFIKK
ncbi:T9SS type A sorting domain-containing protein [Epilithonimonas sp.]|uniref:T9SS type A sorting domain-containing protein n=1 Tax=Epilithonimonas sp. TaxID=2894511 RepID=UPI002899D472|nr:T9SS type A sorting domain-containing protein [Epilithonimonas sp.]